MKLRPYKSTDLEAVVEIFRSNIPKYFGPDEETGLRRFLMDTRGESYFVGELDDEIIGAGGIASNEDGTVSLCWGMLRADYIGKGFGRELTEFRLQMVREKFGPSPVVTSTSQHTKGFYEKFGFRVTEHTPDGFGPGIDTCKMRLDL